MPASAPRLPGLRFETARPPSPPDLPRMDVAAFVGFASAGPVGVPVAVDDEVRFRERFGADLPLAWDPVRGETTFAHLAPAVREFFRNGGRRCWIVRAADEASLEAAVFRIPGMLFGHGERRDAAYLLASSPGSWADGISLNATLLATRVAAVTEDDGGRGILLPADSPELLRVEWNDGTVAFFPPHAGAAPRDATGAERTGLRVRRFARSWWFRAMGWDELESPGRNPLFLAGPRRVRLTLPGKPLDASKWTVAEDEGGTHLRLRLAPRAAHGVQPGAWIQADLHDHASGGGVHAFIAPRDEWPRDGGEHADPPIADSDLTPSVPIEVPRLWSSSDAPEPYLPHTPEPESGEGGEDELVHGGGNGSPGGNGGQNGHGNGGHGGQGNGGQGHGGNGGAGNGGQGGGGGQGGAGDGDPDDDGPGAGEGPGGGHDPAGRPVRAYLLVDDVIREEEQTIVIVRKAWRALPRHGAWQRMSGRPYDAALLSAELWARQADGAETRVSDVGLVPRHPRWLGDFPPDQTRFASAERLTQSAADPLHTELAQRRFPLAATDETYVTDADGAVRIRGRFSADAASLAPGNGPGGKLPGDGTGHDQPPIPEDVGPDPFQAFLPLGVPAVPRDDFYQAAYTSGASPLERDGLGRFAAGLFLDPLLAPLPPEVLLGTAFHNTYVAEPPVPPVRMHALLPIEEVSLLTVPDAVHTGWELREAQVAAPAPDAPVLKPIPQPKDAEGRITVRWSAVDGAVEYRLEDAPDPRFRAGVRATGVGVDADHPGTQTTVIRPQPCPARLYFRVRVRTMAGWSTWSATERLDAPEYAFAACGDMPIDAPSLTVEASAERLSIEWTAAPVSKADDAEYRFRVESSVEPTFGLPELVYEGPLKTAEVWKPASGALFFRAAAEARRPGEACAEESPWSTAHAWFASAPTRWETLRPGEGLNPPAHLVTGDVHRAMLRFCAARSDCFSVLALPRHHREADALAHVAELTASLGATGEQGDAGARTLSFGALYHPWTVVRTPVAAAPLRAIPPDGATAGVMAARANTLGAWAAPANQPLAGVAILDPRLPESVRATFIGNRLNAVAPFPRGFMTWSEETLSTDPDLHGVGVRRLLILLRRLALREGNTYVWEPSNQAFRRMVQRQFDGLLGALYARGAFAGASHAQAYRVVTDDTVNPPQSVDEGRFVVEIRVAPSRPLAFLTVRLVQTGAGVSVAGG